MLGKAKLDDAVTLVSQGSQLIGNLQFTTQLYLNGRVEGDVTSVAGEDATMVISDSGTVVGDIRVANVVISGCVEGNVYASGRVELTDRARVRGNVHYRLMEMQLGAVVEGQLLHHDGPSLEAVAEERNEHKPSAALRQA